MRDKIQDIVVKAVAGTKDITEAIDELLLLYNVSNRRELCKHENYTPMYSQEGDYWGKRCNDCGEDLD